MSHRPLTRPRASLTAVISVGSRLARRERQEIELRTLISCMTVFSLALLKCNASADRCCHCFPPQHWIRLELFPDVLVHRLKMIVDPADSSYMPSLVVVSGGLNSCGVMGI